MCVYAQIFTDVFAYNFVCGKVLKVRKIRIHAQHTLLYYYNNNNGSYVMIGVHESRPNGKSIRIRERCFYAFPVILQARTLKQAHTATQKHTAHRLGSLVSTQRTHTLRGFPLSPSHTQMWTAFHIHISNRHRISGNCTGSWHSVSQLDCTVSMPAFISSLVCVP